jgi:hypothetical protein
MPKPNDDAFYPETPRPVEVKSTIKWGYGEGQKEVYAD